MFKHLNKVFAVALTALMCVGTLGFGTAADAHDDDDRRWRNRYRQERFNNWRGNQRVGRWDRRISYRRPRRPRCRDQRRVILPGRRVAVGSPFYSNRWLPRW